MRLTCALLATGIALLACIDCILAATDATKNSQKETPLVAHYSTPDYPKRILRANAQAYSVDGDSEERMFSPMINGVLGKVGSVVETGGAKVIKEMPKLEKYQKWLNAGLNPSQVRVDVLKKTPWQALSFILRGKDSYQYLKFIVDYKRLKLGQNIPKPAAQMEKHELWLYAGLTPSHVRVDIMKKAPDMKLKVIEKHPDFYQYAKFMVEYKRLNPNANIAFVT
ncbi:hypothetical protein F442_06932 [Phytophthora nicotianae P10297]|uniref:RxLR effector protein n=1 Tax=Phytophthora nicotianae P10297 TaxID=1317064 RepID=W2ZL23_PHYNI|nr:hypothetical protein F442_06932 [Phytophthora nicotianae P10297]